MVPGQSSCCKQPSNWTKYTTQLGTGTGQQEARAADEINLPNAPAALCPGNIPASGPGGAQQLCEVERQGSECGAARAAEIWGMAAA